MTSGGLFLTTVMPGLGLQVSQTCLLLLEPAQCRAALLTGDPSTSGLSVSWKCSISDSDPHLLN